MDPSPTRRSATLTLVLFTVGAALLAGGSLQGCRQLDETADAAEEPNRVQGCWALSLQAQGAQRDSLQTWLPAGSLPSTLELDTIRADSAAEPSRYNAYSWFDGRQRQHPFSVWRWMEGDSIRVQHAGALAGTMLQLHAAPDTLDGRVIVYSDVLMPGTPARRAGAVTAVPTQCPSP